MPTTPQPHPEATAGESAATSQPLRWRLNRAGIINVYQYGNETLQFGGGRLLLRGVNGSGKSTAMNMLLPFLLDADTRRIDAAGEQSGVLRSWMLSGRDEAQPVGYLWLEVAKEGQYLSFGCGIRANRSTDQVTTWWFVTSRRPGIDFQLVEGRVPVSRDGLRVLIEPDLVLGQDQRGLYRAELRKRLFGSADIDQHLRLLRIVRNPRVGDRLDAELPQYLHDALPQLSDDALDDAAQPLEDLEEHRRNVADLERTATTLDAVFATYRNYARTELHRSADGTAGAVRTARDARRKEERSRTTHDIAIEQHRNAADRKRQIGSDVDNLTSAIKALEASEAYKSGAQLNDLRAHVESLGRNKEIAEEALSRRRAATGRAADAVRSAQQEAAMEHQVLGRRVADLASVASACRLTARPPGVPSIAADPDSPHSLELAPAVSALTATEQGFSALQAAGRQRQEDVGTVETAVREVEPAERAMRDAEGRVGEAQAACDDARQLLKEASSLFQSEVEQWQDAAHGWLERLRGHHATHDLGPVDTPAEIGAIIDEILLGHDVGEVLDAATTPAQRHHEGRRAQLEASLGQQRGVVAELEGRAAELAALELPEQPMLGWQRRTGRCFAELVDFAGHVDAASRAGLEAALEASGLLAAEVYDDGALRLADGQLVIAPIAPEVPAPLAALLRPDVQDDDPRSATRAVVERILRAISTDANADAVMVATIDGEFRLGAVRGRHTKIEAEHIGVTARRAALERLRADNARLLADAVAEHERLQAAVNAAAVALATALELRATAPSDRALHQALWRRTARETAVEQAEEQLRIRRAELEAAEQHHAETVAHAKATATRLSLPATRAELEVLRSDLGRLLEDAREALLDLNRLTRAVARWRERGEEWREAHADEQQSEAHLHRVAAEWSKAHERLATLEATIGVDYAQVIAGLARKTTELARARQALVTAEGEVEEAVRNETAAEKDRETAVAARESADQACLQVLAALKRALSVPGLLDAAISRSQSATSGDPAANDTAAPPPASAAAEANGDTHLNAAVVEDSPAGALRLVEAIRSAVPRSDDPVSADGVRQSIRRRRDSLGANWDAEDHQSQPDLPLHVAVTGPLGTRMPLPSAVETVQSQLATMTSLLSTKQHQALRNLLQGLVGREVAGKLHSADELVKRMNQRLAAIKTSHGIGVSLRWRRRDDIDSGTVAMIGLLEKPPDLRTVDEEGELSAALGSRIDDAHREDPGTPYRELIARVLDYREWHRMTILLQRPGRKPERLNRRTALSEGEKKIVSYLPLFAAVAASCDGLADGAPDALRFLLLDDAFAKVSEDNHGKLFGLLVELDLDFIATSERLWGTHDTVPELAITEVIRDADLQTIVLEHSHWNGIDHEPRG